jgi:hypothetical protein
MKYEIGSVTENQTKSGGVWKGVACEEEQFSASRRTISIHDASRSQNAIARIGQEGDRCFTFDLYVNSQSDREKYIIKNNAFAISSPAKSTIGQTPAPAILRLVSGNSRNQRHRKARRTPFWGTPTGIGHWK